jgi:Ankyrin repeats (3 copies)/Carboxypeptidase regulatory-like domain/Ankyrin repeats (many copies)
MSKKSLIDSIEVKDPCSETWDKMSGNDQVRFCGHCSKNVNNISEMTRKDALRLVRGSNGNLCVRYVRHPVTNRPLFVENLYKITRRAPGLAAGVMTASITLSTAAYAQSVPTPVSNDDAVIEKALNNAPKGPEAGSNSRSNVSGTVMGEDGAFLNGAMVTLKNSISGAEKVAGTNDKGFYRFDDVSTGPFTISIVNSGLKSYSVSTFVNGKDDVRQDAVLSAGADDPPAKQVWIGGSVSIRVPKKMSPLSTAVQNDDLDLVKNLIIRGARVNLKEKDDRNATPLFIAVENGNIEIAEVLLRFGAKANARDTGGQTPLMWIDSDASPELIELLVRYGARLDFADHDGNTAITIAADDADAPVVKALIAAGAEVDHQNNDGETALMKAARGDNLESVRALLLAGANVNLKNTDGETALDLAGEDEVIEILKSYGTLPGDPEEDAEDESPAGAAAGTESVAPQIPN